ncbi:MAG: twin-arginine translocase TatA/TatE family subunit [Pirellulales bacterium]
MFGLGAWDMMIVLVIAVLLFGKRLPEVARSLGKGVTEFRKGVRGIEDEFTRTDYSPPQSTSRPANYEDREEPTAPRFVPPPAETPASNATATAESTGAEQAAT